MNILYKEAEKEISTLQTGPKKSEAETQTMETRVNDKPSANVKKL